MKPSDLYLVGLSLLVWTAYPTRNFLQQLVPPMSAFPFIEVVFAFCVSLLLIETPKAEHLVPLPSLLVSAIFGRHAILVTGLMVWHIF